jgi:hypothetical protein
VNLLKSCGFVEKLWICRKVIEKLWICCGFVVKLCCTANPQQIEQMEFEL